MENKEADNKTDNTAVSSGHVDENSHDNATAKQPPAHWHSRITDVSEVDVTNVACSQIFNMFTKCFNPSNQFNHIRRNGDFPNCGDILSDWTICMRAAPQKGEQREVSTALHQLRPHPHLTDLYHCISRNC